MKDLYNNIEVEAVLDPIAISATATYTDIDLQGFNSCCLLIHVGIDASMSGSHKIVYTLGDSDDGTTYTNVETADMVNLTVASGVVLTIDGADDDNTLYKLGYVGGKRYLELVGTVTGTVDPPIGIIAVKGHPEIAAV